MGYTAGGYTAGGYTAGGYTAGGYTAGGYTAGGYTAGGEPSARVDGSTRTVRLVSTPPNAVPCHHHVTTM